MMTEIFKTPTPPTPLHQKLAALLLPADCRRLVRRRENALWAVMDWLEIQGITRALEISDVRIGHMIRPAVVAAVTPPMRRTILYKPHGSVAPAQNYPSQTATMSRS